MLKMERGEKESSGLLGSEQQIKNIITAWAAHHLKQMTAKPEGIMLDVYHWFTSADSSLDSLPQTSYC